MYRIANFKNPFQPIHHCYTKIVLHDLPLPLTPSYVSAREVEGGGVRGEGGQKYVIAVFIQFSFSFGKTANS